MRSIFHLLLLAFIVIEGAGCTSKTASPSSNSSAPPHNSPTIRFRDATQECGINAIYENGEQSNEHSIVESLGGGVGLMDFDRDGCLDAFFPGGGKITKDQPLAGLPNTLWKNLGPAKFNNVSAQSRIELPQTLTHGCSAADIDNDGFCDVLITGYGGLQVLRNQGDGTFIDCTMTSKIDDTAWSSSAAWGDFNEDGNLDLYVAHYVDWSWKNHPQCPTTQPGVFDVCTPNDFGPLRHVVFMSNGDWTFSKRDDEAGLDKGGKGLGVVIADLNDDKRIDIYVANDTTNNFLYLGDGTGRFTDAGLQSGTAVDGNGTPNGSMGLVVFDFNQDQRPDLWVTNYENETYALYENAGNGSFLWATERAGINALGRKFVGFGTTSGDFDQDGDEDIVVANGHVMLHPAQSTSSQQSVFLENKFVGDTRRLARAELEAPSYFSSLHRGRGVVTGDLDNDSDLDLVFSNTREPAALLLNESNRHGTQVQINLVGTKSNRDAIGSVGILKTNKRSYLRTIVGGGSYLSQNPYTLTWSVPEGEQIIELKITWPNGEQQSIQELAVSKPMIVVQR